MEEKNKRTRSEWVASRQRHVEITSELRAILDGLLLSDASISRTKSGLSASLQMYQSPRRREWLEQVQEELLHHGLISTIDTRKVRPAYFKGDQHWSSGGDYLVLRTMSYVELISEFHRWRPGPQKAVPKDLVLMKTTLRHWFCGDGRGGDRKGTLGLCTNGFTHQEVDLLVTLLKANLGIVALNTTDPRGHAVILISRQDEAYKVKTIIGPDLTPCCLYKLHHVRPRVTSGRGRALSAEIIQAIQEDRGHMVVRAAARKHGVSVSKVWNLWNASPSPLLG